MRSKFRTSSKAPPALVRARVSFLAPERRPDVNRRQGSAQCPVQYVVGDLNNTTSGRPLVQTRKTLHSFKFERTFTKTLQVTWLDK